MFDGSFIVPHDQKNAPDLKWLSPHGSDANPSSQASTPMHPRGSAPKRPAATAVLGGDEQRLTVGSKFIGSMTWTVGVALNMW